ncbi:MAG: chloramphenicol phosphotransferase [Actinomycetota bacterium]
MAVTLRKPETGRVIILNGPPRSGKSSTAQALQEINEVPMVTLGVDAAMAATPPSLLPGIGLRPGGERPDLEPFIQANYGALFDSIAAHARQGLDVVADLGIHDSYSRPLGIWSDAAQRLDGLATHVIGLRCSLEVVLERRAAHPDRYATADGCQVPPAVVRWDEAVHTPGWYDLEVDTSELSPGDCATMIVNELAGRVPCALGRHRS